MIICWLILHDTDDGADGVMMTMMMIIISVVKIKNNIIVIDI